MDIQRKASHGICPELPYNITETIVAYNSISTAVVIHAKYSAVSGF
jgi:hypothetical protein